MPVEKDLYCYRGQTYEQNFRFKSNGTPIDLTGAIARAQVKPTENTKALIAEFDVTVTGDEGKITLALSNEITEGLRPGTYRYDLKVVGNERVKYWICGKFIVSGRVTE